MKQTIQQALVDAVKGLAQIPGMRPDYLQFASEAAAGFLAGMDHCIAQGAQLEKRTDAAAGLLVAEMTRPTGGRRARGRAGGERSVVHQGAVSWVLVCE